MIKKTLDARLFRAWLLVENANKHVRIRQQLAAFGYTAERMQELAALIEKAEALDDEKQECYSRKKALSQQMDKDVQAMKALYMEHLTIARFTYRKDAYMQEKLDLTGSRKRHWAGWLNQVHTFYAGLEAEGLAAMKKHGAIAEEIAQGKAMADALMEAYHATKFNNGNAQSATQKRNQVLKMIDRWVMNFKKVASVALEDEPQLLKALGMKVPSRA